MMDRGSYRSIHAVIVDGPDFQALSPGAKLVWYTLKMTLGPSGIEVVPALVATLIERTGADQKQVEKGLAQLEANGWLRRERNVVWMVDGLKHDPHLQLTNQNHRTMIARHVNGLPRLPIVDEFRTHYGLAEPPSEMPSARPEHTTVDGGKMPSKMASNIPSTNREKGEGKGRREREKGEGNSSAATSATGKKSRAGRPTWLTPFADAWRSRYGGEMSAGRAVQSLAKLVEHEGSDEVLRRWVIYLDATAAEYANAPKFASTWGRWERPVLRSSGSSGSSSNPASAGPNLAEQARAEAMQVVARVRALVYDQVIPGQSSRKLLRVADVEAMGADVAAAVRDCGGVARVLKLETDASDISFYLRDFATALAAARRAAPTSTGASPEAQSA